MELAYKKQIRFAESLKNTVSCFDNLVAIPSPENARSISLWQVDDNSGECVESSLINNKLINGHPESIDLVCFGNASLTLASACRSAINVWYCDSVPDFKKLAPQNLIKELGRVNFMSFSPDDLMLSICTNTDIWVIEIKFPKHVATFAHNSIVEAADFCKKDSNFLITISKDGTYAIWNLLEKCQVIQSSVICVTGLNSLAMHPFEEFFSVGSVDGTLHVFDASNSKVLHKLDFEALMSKEINSMPRGGYSILSLKYLYKRATLSIENHVQKALEEELYLVAGCSTCILIFNASSMTKLASISFEETNDLYVASCYAVSTYKDHVNIFVLGCFSKCVHVFEASKTSSQIIEKLSVLSLDTLAEKSPLKSEYPQKKLNAPKPDLVQRPGSKVQRPDSQKVLINKPKMHHPVVFNKQIKSSGYSKDKPRTMFQPLVKKPKAKVDFSNKVGPWGMKSEPKNLQKSYPLDCDPPTTFLNDFQLVEGASPVNDVCFSDSGKSIACALGDKNAVLLKLPAMKNEKPFIGHDKAVNSVCISHANNLIITSSADQTVKLWFPGHSEPILNISHYKNSLSEEKISHDPNNQPFCKGIGGAIFYFNDKFILLSHGNSLCLYKYNIDSSKDDLKRYLNNNRYKLVHDFNMGDVQVISSFSAMNSFYSYLVLASCSNRDIFVYDMNVGQIRQTIKDAHTRLIHSLKQNQGSVAVTQASEAYDLFVTAASTDGVKLWDLRLSRCVRKFEGHINRSQKIGLSFSPCSKYIAVGSEDRSVYIYDIRSSSYLHRLGGHSDVVTAVAFHPVNPMIACGSRSGQLRFYINELFMSQKE
ncbi:WD repeat-containing protein 27 isoform X2 [Hydra vulgaris]|uniref:WD repeat-containing protein 27 isoform X2 n=1 Tax=Hydra vulgaris TaxID=6087 RepID=A0ABM4CGP8_HYDVU